MGTCYFNLNGVMKYEDCSELFCKDTNERIILPRNDFTEFDLYNTDEQKVIEAKYFSIYKGSLVIKMSMLEDSSGFSFGAIFLDPSVKSEDTVKHEYGHVQQLKKLGFWDYIAFVAIPSVLINRLDANDKLKLSYYGAPWEAEADKLGGANRNHDNEPWPEWYNSLYWLCRKIL